MTTGDAAQTNGHTNNNGDGTGMDNFTVKAGLAQMLKGGVIMDVVNVEQVNQYQSTQL